MFGLNTVASIDFEKDEFRWKVSPNVYFYYVVFFFN